MRSQYWLSIAAGIALLGGCTTSRPADHDASIDAPFVIELDSGPPFDGGVDARPACEAGEIDCDGVCTRVAGDSNNCGSCGNVCPAGSSCAIGRCDCYEPMLGCDGICTDPFADPENCGSCGHVCAPTETCSSGECIISCTEADHRVCVNRDESGAPMQICADLLNDPLNCGACNTRCAGGSSCVMGRCACPTGSLACSGMCTDVSTDPNNCGACRNSCGTGGTCAGSMCTSCGTDRTMCSGRCVDTMTDRLNCGSCARACGTGEACSGGLCECATGLMDCGSGCTNPLTDVNNCGGCGITCGPGGVCSSGTCTCATGLTMCGPECADLMRDEEHCGDCMTTCATGEACQMGTCVLADSFRVLSFGTTNCRTVDHGTPSGDDRGGVAVSPTQLFVTGDLSTVRMSAADLSGVAAVGAVHDGMIGDLESEDVYVLLTAAGTEVSYSSPAVTITQLGRLDPATGALTTTRIPLSMPITVASGTALMSGYGEALIGVLVTGTFQWWHVELPTGTVTRLGNTSSPTHRTCENWAFWGVAEFFGDVHYATFVSSTTQIVRLAIPATGMSTAAPTTVSTFTNLGDMCSITFSPSRNRWYFHHEYDSQFSATPSGEIAGSCDGSFDRP